MSSASSSPPDSPLPYVQLSTGPKSKRARSEPGPGRPPNVATGAAPSGGLDSRTFFCKDSGFFWQLRWDYSIPGSGTPCFYCKRYDPFDKDWVNHDEYYFGQYSEPTKAALAAARR